MNTPLCNIKRTIESNKTPANDDQMSDVPKYVPNKPDLNLVQLDPGNQFTDETKAKLKDIIIDHSIIFQDDLPGYNNVYGQVEATFEWATKSRPQPVKARQPDYNKAGNKLFNDKCLELLSKGVLQRAGDLKIQPRLKNNAFLVKKQSSVHKNYHSKNRAEQSRERERERERESVW